MKIKKIYEGAVLDKININKVNNIPYIEIELSDVKSNSLLKECAYYFFDEKNKDASIKELQFLLSKLNKSNNLNEENISIDLLAELLRENLGQQVVYIERIDNNNSNSHQKKILKNLEINLLSKYFY